jgi:hypothetical protein
MPPHAPTDWQPLIDHLLVQGMAEAIASSYRPIWPFIGAAREQELATPGQLLTPLLNLLATNAVWDACGWPQRFC